MPPPTALDPWLQSRRFGIVIDAGSSGSRLQIYSWKDSRVITDPKLQNTLPKVEKGTKDADWVSKVEPGISSFASKPDEVGPYLAPLLRHALDNVPPRLHKETPIFLLATAGMRLLPHDQQSGVLSAACDFLRFHSDFRVGSASGQGPCGRSVRIISGEEEGLFGWIAVNYLMDGFDANDAQRTTYGFLDMGGASTQIAFEPSTDSPNLKEVRLRLLGGEEISHRVFVTTWLGYGTNQARERYVASAIDDYELTRSSNEVEIEEEHVPDPCLPKGLEILESPVHTGPSTPHSRKAHKLMGTGSFTKCMLHTAPLLNKHAPCPDSPCLFNGVHVPIIDFSVSRFIGVSEYWYSSEHVFGLGGAYDFVQYEKAAVDFCQQDWKQIVEQHRKSKVEGHLGGDGEVVEGGQVVDTGKWGNDIEISRLRMQCFKAAWIANVLHEGIGIPRITDPGGRGQVGEGGSIAGKKAAQKGLGAPAFQSLDTIGDTAISWTLGKMVLEASKEIQPASKAASPIQDPLDTALPLAEEPRRPLLDFDAIEDKFSHRIPSSLSRHSLGFSPLGIIFYISIFLALAFLAHRLRNRIRFVSRRFVRRALKRDQRDVTFNSYNMEEGMSNGAYNSPPLSRPGSPAQSEFNLARHLVSSSKSFLASFLPTPGSPHPNHVSNYHAPIPSSLRSRNASSYGNGSGPYGNSPSNLQVEVTAEEIPPSPVHANLSLPWSSSTLNLAARPARSGSQTPTGPNFPYPDDD